MPARDSGAAPCVYAGVGGTGAGAGVGAGGGGGGRSAPGPGARPGYFETRWPRPRTHVSPRLAEERCRVPELIGACCAPRLWLFSLGPWDGPLVLSDGSLVRRRSPNLVQDDLLVRRLSGPPGPRTFVGGLDPSQRQEACSSAEVGGAVCRN